jgi:hypothetical protein
MDLKQLEYDFMYSHVKCDICQIEHHVQEYTRTNTLYKYIHYYEDIYPRKDVHLICTNCFTFTQTLCTCGQWAMLTRLKYGFNCKGCNKYRIDEKYTDNYNSDNTCYRYKKRQY